MRDKKVGISVCALLIGVLALAGGIVACSEEDCKPGGYRMTWVNNYDNDVILTIEGRMVEWLIPNDPNGTYPGETFVPARSSRTTWLFYPAGHYEYMVGEKVSGKGVICEGRFDLDADHTTFEMIPTPGGSTYEGAGGGFCG